MARLTALILLALGPSTGLAQPKPAITRADLEQVRRRIRTYKPVPYLLNKDGTPHRAAQDQPAAPQPAAPKARTLPPGGTLGDWLRFAHEGLTRR